MHSMKYWLKMILGRWKVEGFTLANLLLLPVFIVIFERRGYSVDYLWIGWVAASIFTLWHSWSASYSSDINENPLRDVLMGPGLSASHVYG